MLYCFKFFYCRHYIPDEIQTLGFLLEGGIACLENEEDYIIMKEWESCIRDDNLTTCIYWNHESLTNIINGKRQLRMRIKYTNKNFDLKITGHLGCDEPVVLVYTIYSGSNFIQCPLSSWTPQTTQLQTSVSQSQREQLCVRQFFVVKGYVFV